MVNTLLIRHTTVDYLPVLYCFCLIPSLLSGSPSLLVATFRRWSLRGSGVVITLSVDRQLPYQCGVGDMPDCHCPRLRLASMGSQDLLGHRVQCRWFAQDGVALITSTAGRVVEAHPCIRIVDRIRSV